jgi:hypothetical protein
MGALLLDVIPFLERVRRMTVEADRRRRTALGSGHVQVDRDSLPVSLVQDVVLAKIGAHTLRDDAEALDDVAQAARPFGRPGRQGEPGVRPLELLEGGSCRGGLELDRHILSGHAPQSDLLARAQDAERRSAARIEEPVRHRLGALLVVPVDRGADVERSVGRSALVSPGKALLPKPQEEALLERRIAVSRRLVVERSRQRARDVPVESVGVRAGCSQAVSVDLTARVGERLARETASRRPAQLAAGEEPIRRGRAQLVLPMEDDERCVLRHEVGGWHRSRV